MSKFHLSIKAKTDINNIWEYTLNKWSQHQADKYFSELQNQFSKIAKHPDQGRKYDYISENLLGIKFKSHIIFYNVISPTEVEIFRILHEQMDLPTRLIE